MKSPSMPENQQKNLLAIFFLSFGYIALQMILTPVRIRVVTGILSVEDYTRLNMVIMNISFVGVMLSLGSYEYLLRKLPGASPEFQLAVIKRFTVFFGGLTLVGALVGVVLLKLLLPDDSGLTTYDIVLCGIGLLAWGHLLQRCIMLMARSEMFKYRITQFFYGDFWFVPLALGFLFIPAFNFHHILTIWVGWMVLVAILLIRFIPYRQALKSDASLVPLKDIIIFSLPLLPMLFGEWLFRIGDRWFLLILHGEVETGYYMVAMNIALIAFMVGQQLLSMIAAKFNQLKNKLTGDFLEAPHTSPDMRAIFSIMLRYCWILSIVTAVAFCLSPEAIVGILADAKFAPAATILPWAAPVSFFFLTGTVFCRTLITLDRTRTVAVVTLGAAAINLGLNALFVPGMAKEGAALATVLSLVCMALFSGIAIRAWRWIDATELKAGRILVFTALCVAAFYLAEAISGYMLITLAIGGLLSLASLFALGLFKKRELLTLFGKSAEDA
ncbi:MAG: O-antigen/teichoic acid export membrane protein [Kiritimatiellia bacterium]|jgi:O-antigen/teichoic acid export membrane protein